MRKDLVIDFEKCTGCRVCEIACSLYNKNMCNSAKSSIHVIKWEEEGICVPMVCQQCEVPMCEMVCPSGALSRDNDTGAVIVDEDKCVGCRMCMIACPFGGVSLDPDTRKVIKCNFCEGDPKCVKFCEPEAITYKPATTFTYLRKKEGAEKLSTLLREIGIK